jgi:signal transduction histidine kinase
MLDELSRMRDRVVRAAALSAVGELSARIVHEMRNPLSSVKMNVKALRQKVAEDPAYAELADIAGEQAARLEHMLSDLLNYGKPIELKRDVLRFDRVAADLESTMGPVAADNGVTLSVRDGTRGKPFLADREQLLRALSNLVDNGIRAAKGGGVSVEAVVRGVDAQAELLMTVSDTGPGIADAVREKLFEPFVTTQREGTGLGLANVRKIVQLHGGSVTAENRAAGGAEFRVVLPAGDVTGLSGPAREEQGGGQRPGARVTRRPREQDA